MFYQKRTTSGTMLSQTRNLYGLRNRQNVVCSHSYNFHPIQSITTPSILSILHLILLMCVFYQMRRTCGMMLSQTHSLYEHQNWYNPVRSHFANMFKLYVMLGGSLGGSAPTLAPALYKCINADVCCLCIRRFGSTRSPCAGRRFSTRS